MNIQITHRWLLEYLDTEATPEQIQKYLTLCGPSIERIEKKENDYIYDIEITSNRVDTASVMGIAREAAAILNRFNIKTVFKPPQLNIEKYDNYNKPLPLIIKDENKLCYRLLAVVMEGVKISQSPSLVKYRLEAAGIRSLNNLVDITNYVMLEIGHPTHVFDYDRIKTNTLIIRNAKKGEEIITLDGKKYFLNTKDIIIDDGTGRVIDLPGIMGTENSVVAENTKRIIFFIESNNPSAIRASSMRYGIRTMAATINEKYPDPETAKLALLKGIQLFKKLASAKQSSDIIDIYPAPEKQKTVTLPEKDVKKLIGVEIPKKDIVNILNHLGFNLLSDVNGKLSFKVPSYRNHDILIKEDLIEEIARIYGYANLPSNLQPQAYIKQPENFEQLFSVTQIISQFLKHIGLSEVINYSMISKDLILNCDLKPEDHLVIKNTISEEIKYLRTNLIPSLIKNIKTNEGKQMELKFFEIAKTYRPKTGELPEELYELGIITNTSYPDLKGIIDGLLSELNIIDYTIEKTNQSLFINASCGKIIKNNIELGEFGQLKPVYQLKNNVKSNIYIALFKLSSLIKFYTRMKTEYKPISQYSVIKLDLTINQNPDLTYLQLKQKAFQISKLLINLEFLNLYENKLSLRFYFSSYDRNITDKEALIELSKITKELGIKSV